MSLCYWRPPGRLVSDKLRRRILRKGSQKNVRSRRLDIGCARPSIYFTTMEKTPSASCSVGAGTIVPILRRRWVVRQARMWKTTQNRRKHGGLTTEDALDYESRWSDLYTADAGEACVDPSPRVLWTALHPRGGDGSSRLSTRQSRVHTRQILVHNATTLGDVLK